MPGQKINRTCDNKFLEKVKNERIRLKDSQILNNYCAVQVNFGPDHTGHVHTQEAISFSVRGSSFSVGYHSEIRAIANCINKELESAGHNILGSPITFGTNDEVNLDDIKRFFRDNPGCRVIGYSDRQPCKEPSFINNPDQGCEKFLEAILPGEKHKIDYSFEYSKVPAQKQDGTLISGHFQYTYDNNALQKVFQEEGRLAATVDSTPKPKITYFKPKAILPVAETAQLPTDTATHSSSAADMGNRLEELAQIGSTIWGAANADLAMRETESPATFQTQTQAYPGATQASPSEGAKEHPIEVDSSDDELPKAKHHKPDS